MKRLILIIGMVLICTGAYATVEETIDAVIEEAARKTDEQLGVNNYLHKMEEANALLRGEDYATEDIIVLPLDKLKDLLERSLEDKSSAVLEMQLEIQEESIRNAQKKIDRINEKIKFINDVKAGI